MEIPRYGCQHPAWNDVGGGLRASVPPRETNDTSHTGSQLSCGRIGWIWGCGACHVRVIVVDLVATIGGRAIDPGDLMPVQMS